jgi:hypothetical protein
MGGQQGSTGCVRAHLSVAQNEMRQHGENGFTLRALKTELMDCSPAD